MILKDVIFKTFKNDESYCLPYSKVSLDRAAVMAALILIDGLKNKSFGIQLDGSFEGVILTKDLELLQKQLKEESLKLNIDSYFE